MAIAGTLEIQMMANLARLQKDMDDAKRMVGGSMASIEKSIKSVMGLFGVGFGVNYFIGLVDSSIEAQDHLNDLKKSTGLAITELAGLKLAAAQSGADLNSIADSINKLSVNIGKDAERFKALGITAKDPLQAFKQLADIFVMIDDPQQRAALAAAALGKSWAGAAPLLGEGGARIQEMVDKGALLSGVTQESADQADQYKDRLAELQTSMGAVTTRMVGELLPGLNDIANAMREASKEGSILLTIWVPPPRTPR